jgi:hypothetical protein
MMTVRSALVTLAVPIALAWSAAPARAQAWLPPQGEGSVSFLFSDILANNHFFGTQPVDAGRIRSETIAADVTYGLTDRVAISASIPVVASKYTGNSNSPFAAPHPQPLYPGVNPLDDGSYHAEWQDFRFGLRYNLLKRRGFALTPFVGSIVPSHNYEIFAHAAPGRDLNELQLGASAAKVFEAHLPGVFVQASYSYGIVQQVLDISHNRSMLSAEIGYFVTPKVRVLGLSGGQITHGGIDQSPALGFDPIRFPVHDQISRDDFLTVGAGVGYAMNEKIDLFGSVIHALASAQRNSHQINRGVTVGLTWSFSTKRANDRAIASNEKALARCVCEKGTK